MSFGRANQADSSKMLYPSGAPCVAVTAHKLETCSQWNRPSSGFPVRRQQPRGHLIRELTDSFGNSPTFDGLLTRSVLSKKLTHFLEACTILLPINSLEGSRLPAVSASKSETFQSSVLVRTGCVLASLPNSSRLRSRKVLGNAPDVFQKGVQ